MKNFLLACLLISLGKQLAAQCSFDASVTPANPILCPNSTDTLWTEEYDSYQWYKGNNIIAGATNQFYVVTENDILKKFKVEATLDGCTEFSEAVLVDGYVFLLPFVVHSGDVGTYDPNYDATILCEGDTLILTYSYTANVQWFNNGDSIPGATDPEFLVTESGSYTACGAPDVCPNYQACLGLNINVIFGGEKPVITLQNDTLFTSVDGTYHWYLNSAQISGATNSFYVPSVTGEYSVKVIDEFNCTAVSDPFDFVATGSGSEIPAHEFELYPNPASNVLMISAGGDGSEEKIFSIQNSVGQIILSGKLNKEVFLDVSHLSEGMYFVIVETEGQKMIRKLMKN